MEQKPKFEKKESPEQQFVRLLKEKGAEDPETKKFLDTWIREKERQVEQLTGEEYYIAQIQLTLELARLSWEGGCQERALENFEIAQELARQEKRNDLYLKITKEIDELEDSIEKQK